MTTRPVCRAALFLALGGCVSSGGEPWSSKSQSMATADAPGAAGPAAGAPGADRVELRGRAIAAVLEAAASAVPQVRANAIEAAQHEPGHVEALAKRGLTDENRGVRFVSAMTVGNAGLRSLAGQVEPLLLDESESVRAAAIFALRRCGLHADLSPLGRFIRSDDPEVRANAALVLAELRNPSAAPMIRDAVGAGMRLVPEARVRVVNLQMAEAMVRLGAEAEIEAVRAALFAPPEQGELTALACMMCGRLGDRRSIPNLEQLARRAGPSRPPAEVRMAAVWALAGLDPARADEGVPLEYRRSDRPELRAQSALTLGRIASPAALQALAALLEDPDPLVRVAAAAAVLQATS